ncbi:hypothetical protein [Vibrio astriarenae]|uniref:hypothetical protein n=1 Tax=Vibrio astriarenae TaxID=1481923 RepID=UPI003735A99F
MSNSKDKRIYRTVGDTERVEYPCERCDDGLYHYNAEGMRMSEHNQLPHACKKCGHEVYFSHPYPALRYKGRIFVDWETIRGQMPRT